MTHDWHGRPLVRIEPALWTWRGQPVRVEESVEWGLPPVQNPEHVRIGDAERDRAVSTLGDHFAAGRLTREEFDERSDQAMQARFTGDLQPLFADLPRSRPPALPGAPTRVPPQMFFAFAMLAPLLIVTGVIAAMVFSAPWILWTFLMVFLLSGFWRRRHRHFAVRSHR
jgi:Domain of unknown function (DUF1707)